MSLTRSHFLTEPATKSTRDPISSDGFGLIVAHGSPSDPDMLRDTFCHLAKGVQKHASRWQIQTASLGEPGTLKAAISAFPPGEPIKVYPFFMSDGWFASEELPRRLENITQGVIRYLTPLGLDPQLPNVCVGQALQAAKKMGQSSQDCTLILAAHGSPNTCKPARAAKRIRSQIHDRGLFHDVRLGFIEERPSLAEVAICSNPSICLPLFATSAAHVKFDIPKVLNSAGFTGKILPPIGEAREILRLIANAFRRAHLDKS